MKKLNISIVIIISVITSSCLLSDYDELKINNLTNKDFHVESSDSYPDTVSFHLFFNSKPGSLVKANSSTGVNLIRNRDIHQFFEYDILENDTLIVVIVDGDVVKLNSNDDILSKQLYLQRYYLSYDDIMQLKSELYFPPTPEMSNVRMFPPYGTYDEDGSIKNKESKIITTNKTNLQ